MEDSHCTFYLEIEHKLTMMRYKDLVYPANGNLYKYDVVNVSVAQPISSQEVITADGWEEPRLVAVVNGSLPGPDIIVYENQTVTVYVKNHLRSVAVTIHWHGLHQTMTPWMDGVPYVTQCPIQPGQSFKYEFKAKPKGTFWYHSHVGATRSMGIFGAFIIREKKVTNVEEHIMQIQDWNHDWDSDTAHMKMLYGVYSGRSKWSGAQSLDGSFFSMFRFQSGLINGRGRVHSPINNMAPLTVFNVEQGKKYRFRVIGPGSLYPFRVSVDDHPLTIVASDGYDLEPVTAESFVINPGERFDFEITADKDIKNYWIRGVTLEKNVDHRAEAILRYQGSDDEEPTTDRRNCTSDNPCSVLNCPFTYYPSPNTICRTFDELQSAVLNDPAPPVEAGKFEEYFLNFAFPGIKSYPGSVNGRTFDTPDVNPLLQPAEWHSPCLAPECGDDRHCKCTFALNIGRGDTVQMVWMNMGRGKGWSHPIHLHGHSFYVLKMGYGRYNESDGKIMGDNLDVDCRGHPDREQSFCNDATWSDQSWLNGNVPGLNTERPPRKDTLIIPTGGYAVVRIRADNPGIWNMHCHIELHNLDGMQMLLNESFSEVPTPPSDFPACHSYPSSPYRKHMMEDESEEGREEELDSEDKGFDFKRKEFWIVVGVFIGVVVIQFLIICGLCMRMSRRSSGPKNISSYGLSGQINSGFSQPTKSVT